MDIRTHQFSLVLATLAILSALSLPGVFLWPINALMILWPIDAIKLHDYYAADGMLLGSFIDVLRILFLVVPVVAVFGAIRSKRWALYVLMAFPLVAWVFGAAAIPYIAFIFPPVAPRTIAITIINLLVIAVVVWLRWRKSNFRSSGRAKSARRSP
jgi:hypothetical protein